MGVDTLVRDPQFINLPLAQQRLALQAATGDKDFASISDKDFTLFLNAARNATLTGFEKERTPGPNGGAWNAIKNDVGGAAEGLVSMAGKTPAGMAVEMGMRSGVNDLARKQEGRSLPYRVVAGVGENVTPLNVRGMEEAANSGDTSGVVGHGAAGVGMAAAPVAAEGLIRGVPLVARAAKPAVAAGARVASEAVNPEVTGLLSPRLAHAQRLLGRFADALKNGKPIATEELGDLTQEAQFPVTTPSDVPLEQMPSEAAQPTLADLSGAPGIKPKIRASTDAARSYRSLADLRDDEAIKEAMSEDLYRHGRNAYAEQRALNTVDVPKWQRVAEAKAAMIMQNAQKQLSDVMNAAEMQANTVKLRANASVKPSPSVPLSEAELNDLLERSIAQAKAKRKQ